jgi:predicted metalloprotease
MVRWRGRRGSENVEDMRGAGGAMSGIVFLLLRLILSRFGILGLVVLAGGFFLLQAVGLNPLGLLQGQPAGGGKPPANDETAQFVSVVLAETESAWAKIFADAGMTYQPPRLVLFSGQINSACGFASAAVGPFYCPGDRKVYLDAGFFQELAQRFGAPGDFAAAYVIAHEVGHHVQTLTGVSDQVQALQARSSERDRNAVQVRMELQADCYAGVWAHSAERMSDFIERGDIEEGLQAASAIGDDTLQREAGRRVQPESFTHGTSEQRTRWFLTGYRSGDPDACDTFEAGNL